MTRLEPFKLARSRMQTEAEDLMTAHFLNSWDFSDCNECCLEICYEGFNRFGAFRRSKSINNVFCKRRQKLRNQDSLCNLLQCSYCDSLWKYG